MFKIIKFRFMIHSIFYRRLSMNIFDALNFIDGQRQCPTQVQDSIKNINPATGSILCKVPISNYEDVNSAVKSAKKAFANWSQKCPRERGKILIKAAEKIREKIFDLAKIEVEDTGKPIWEAKLDIAGCADVLEYYGSIASTIKGIHHNLPDGNFAIIQREALGVVAGIGAWNYPFQVMTWKIAPALACGNTFIYKPSEFTPLTSVILAEILTESGLPPGVINVIQGGQETGKLICSHSDISKVTFTGSLATGQKIMKSCADTMKQVTMELGGKSALLVFDDCNIKNAIKATLIGNFLTQGEVCSNCTRVFIQEKIFPIFVEKLIAATENLKVGDPLKDDTMVGAIINENQAKKIFNFINEAQEEGALLICGGKQVIPDENYLKGIFISPCVLTNCTDKMKIVKEEVFGPVVCLLSFNNEDEAIARANASPYGLAAGVMTKDLQRAHRVASALEAGIVWINNYNVFHPEMPFGGYKMSGFGRENGLAAIDYFTQLKTIYVEMNKNIDCPFLKE